MPRVTIHQESPVLDIHVAKDEPMVASLIPRGIDEQPFPVIRIGTTTIFCSIHHIKYLEVQLLAIFQEMRVRDVPQSSDSPGDTAGVTV